MFILGGGASDVKVGGFGTLLGGMIVALAFSRGTLDVDASSDCFT